MDSLPSGPGFALITGASRGIGAALAAALAAEGHPLILTARSTDELRAQQQRLQRPGLDVHTVAADLACGGAAQLLETLAEHRWPVDLLINNAGVGSRGAFATLPAARELDEVRLNVEATVALTRAILPSMVAARRGAVMNVASTAALQPVPYMATYAATKVFLLHFSLALREELRDSGVHVMALCPGATETGFFAAAGVRPPSELQSAEEVARRALRGLRQRRAIVICRPGERVLNAVERLLPREMLARIAAGVVKSRYQNV